MSRQNLVAGDTVTQGKLGEGDSSFLIEDDRRVLVIAVAQVGLVTARRDFEARVSVGSQRHKTFEEIEPRERLGGRHAFAGAADSPQFLSLLRQLQPSLLILFDGRGMAWA
jgi:hypothetical protein